MSESLKAAFLFPGQGSQTVGMGRDLYENFRSAREVFEEADETLGFSLSGLCFEGPESDLRQTINAQPALLTASYACLKAAGEAGLGLLPSPVFVAGHSLGEYTALAAAGAVDFRRAVSLARERGRLMFEAGLKQPGGMTAIIELDEVTLSDICRETGTWIANINCPGQIVISGDRDAVAKAAVMAKERGARAIPLAVSGAFHTPLMQPAADGMSPILASLVFRDPSVPVVANTTAQPLKGGAAIRDELLTQLCHCVLWQRSVEYMISQGVSIFIEIGPGKVLTGLVKRVRRDVAVMNVGDAAAIKGLLGPSF